MNQPTFHYTRVRKVRPLVRANAGDAGIDFFVPTNLTVKDLVDCQADQVKATYGLEIETKSFSWVINTSHLTVKGKDKPLDAPLQDYVGDLLNEEVIAIRVRPNARVLIPSGIRALITPRASMLQAANKSGVSTKKGLIFGAEIVDSPYTGEIHISVINTSVSEVLINANEKLVQFIHVPIYDTEPEEIPQELYASIAENWGTRGDGAFGSSDKETEELDYEEELRIRDAQLSV